MMEFWTEGSKTGFDVSEALPIRELSKGHAEELLPTREASNPTIPLVVSDCFTERVLWDIVHQLREDSSSNIHAIAIRW